MVASVFHHAVKYRQLLTAAFFAVMTIHGVMRKAKIPAKLNDMGEIPDAAFLGYTEEQLRTWYEALGDQGREGYLEIAVLDFAGFMPIYVFLLTAQMISSEMVGPLVYTPLVALFFDLCETLIHCYACYSYPDIPASPILRFTSVATILKFVFLYTSIAIPFVRGIWKKATSNPETKEKEKTN